MMEKLKETREIEPLVKQPPSPVNIEHLEEDETLRELILEPSALNSEQKQHFYKLLGFHHKTFSLKLEERVETN